jgi:hypothetical protein
MKRAAGFVIVLAVILAVLWLIKPVREIAMSIAASGAVPEEEDEMPGIPCMTLYKHVASKHRSRRIRARLLAG